MKFDNPRLKEPLLGKWYIDDFIGSGQYGKVYKAHCNEDRTPVAIKIISMPNEEIRKACEAQYGSEDELEEFMSELIQRFTSEVEAMQLLRRRSENIIQIYDNRAVQEGIYWDVIIVMEYATPLKKYISRNGMTIDEALRLGLDVASALTSCEHNDIIHRDIKEDNLFIGSNGAFKIGDFGVARTENGFGNPTQGIGTYNYMAPEVHRGMAYDHSVDIYSLGIVLYKLFNNGKLPFINSGINGTEANNRRMSGERFPYPEKASEEIAQVILKCCEYEPMNRYRTAAELINDLNMLRASLSDYERSFKIRSESGSTVGRTMDLGTTNGVTAGVTVGGVTGGVQSHTTGGNRTVSSTVGVWASYDPNIDFNRNNGGQNTSYDGDMTHGININNVNNGGGYSDATSGSTMKMSYGADDGNKTVDIIKKFVSELGGDSPIIRKLTEKNMQLEGERQNVLHERRKNKTKMAIIWSLIGVVIAALASTLLVIVFSTSYFANESDYHRIYSRSIVRGERLFDETQVAYLSKEDNYLYFSELDYKNLADSSYQLCKMNIKTKEKTVICAEKCHFDVVIDDYIYFTSNETGKDLLYRISKKATAENGDEKQLLLDASCYDLKADGKTLIFSVLDMNGQERKLDTTKIEK